MDEVVMSSTASVRSLAESLLSDAEFYGQVSQQLESANSSISTNWEGDSTDIESIRSEISYLKTSFGVELSLVKNLATALVEFADNVDKTAGVTVDDSKLIDTETTSVSESSSNEKGFWSVVAADFKDDWDFSHTEGLISGVGDLGNSVLNFLGSTTNTVFKCLGEILGFVLR